MADQGDRESVTMGRLRRIEGQVRGLQQMVEEDQYYIDVLTQGSPTLRPSRRRCSRSRHEKVREASDAIARLVRS